MELSKTFGVERGNPFEVKGYKGKEFRINTFVSGVEYLEIRNIGGIWDLCQVGVMCNIIAAAPSGIIHLPPPLTDEQREQLRAIWTLGGRWLAKNADLDVYAYSVKPEQSSDWAEWVPIKYDEDELQFTVYRYLDVCSLVSWSDPEPYDIGKALGAEGC